jgi:hypothetical protein
MTAAAGAALSQAIRADVQRRRSTTRNHLSATSPDASLMIRDARRASARNGQPTRVAGFYRCQIFSPPAPCQSAGHFVSRYLMNAGHAPR